MPPTLRATFDIVDDWPSEDIIISLYIQYTSIIISDTV